VNFKDKDDFKVSTSIYLTFSKQEGGTKAQLSGALLLLKTSIDIDNPT